MDREVDATNGGYNHTAELVLFDDLLELYDGTVGHGLGPWRNVVDHDLGPRRERQQVDAISVGLANARLVFPPPSELLSGSSAEVVLAPGGPSRQSKAHDPC